MRGIRYGNFQIEIIDGAGGRVERVSHRRPVEALLRPRPRPHQAPPQVPLGRERESADAIADLHDGVPIEFHAPCGFGRSTLLRHLAAHAGSRLGVPGVYLNVAGDGDVDDVLGRLVGALYTADPPVKLTADECAAILREARVVVALDDVTFGPRQVADLVQTLSGCGIVLGCARPVVGRRGTSQLVSGLADDAAIELVRRRLGRPLAGGERAEITRLASAVEGQPLRLTQAAALVAAGEQTFASLADRAESDPAELDRLSVDALAAPERRLLAVLTLTAGALLPRDLLEVIGDIGRVDEAVAGLRGRGLADQGADRFGLPVCLVENYRQLLYRYLDLAGTARDIIDFLVAREPGGEASLSAVDAVVSLIGYAAERGEWTTVTQLVRAAEPILTLAGRWRAAAHALDAGQQAAQAIGDTAAEALFAHQRGTLALCQDDPDTAVTLLSRALELREQLGDDAGAEVTRHNLALIAPVPVPPRPRPRRSWRELRRPATIAGLIITIVVTGAGAVARAMPDPASKAEPSPSASPDPTGTGDPTPTPAQTTPGAPTPTRTGPSGAGPSPAPAPLGPPQFAPGGDPTFGTVNISKGTAPEPRTFTVVNPNDRAIVLGRPVTSGGSAFQVEPGGCAGATLVPDGTCELTVTFAPTELGERLATLSVPDRDGRATSTALTGTGYVDLTVAVRGGHVTVPGTVGVSGRPEDCPPKCAFQIIEPSITLTAEPDNAKVAFERWIEEQGDEPCKGTPTANPCTLELSTNTAMTAYFVPR